jgi:hypothetical protein
MTEKPQETKRKAIPYLYPLLADLKNHANDFSEGLLPKPTLYRPQTSFSLTHWPLRAGPSDE